MPRLKRSTLVPGDGPDSFAAVERQSDVKQWARFKDNIK